MNDLRKQTPEHRGLLALEILRDCSSLSTGHARWPERLSGIARFEMLTTDGVQDAEDANFTLLHGSPSDMGCFAVEAREYCALRAVSCGCHSLEIDSTKIVERYEWKRLNRSLSLFGSASVPFSIAMYHPRCVREKIARSLGPSENV